LRRDALAGAAPHAAWVSEQCRRENLSPDGIGAKIHESVDTGEISAEDARLLVRSLLSAGIDTTVNALGAAVYCLARFPTEMAKLNKNPSLARAAFEETIRFESPAQTFSRTTTRPAEIGGVQLDAGEKVRCYWAPPIAIRANRTGPIFTTSSVGRRAMSGSALAFICASANCWRGSRAKRFSRPSPEG
jgi:4-methoxybenzoate monooxygenase (O-demethylating)